MGMGNILVYMVWSNSSTVVRDLGGVCVHPPSGSILDGFIFFKDILRITFDMFPEKKLGYNTHFLPFSSICSAKILASYVIIDGLTYITK